MLACVIRSTGPAPLFAQSFEPRTKDAPQQQERSVQQSKPQSSTANNAPDSRRDDTVTWFEYKVAELRALNKITGRTRTFRMAVGKSRKFGDIYVRLRACREPPPIEKRESAAFLQVWERGTSGESQWVFSGWMFASSPALSSMDHPVYDVWLLDCTDKVGGEDEQKSTKKAQSGQDAEETEARQDHDTGRQTAPAVESDNEPVIERERLPAQ
jgi:hypothetical protein